MSANTNSLDDVISKSLDEIEELVKNVKDNSISKAMSNPAPDEVSEDAKEEEQEGQEGEAQDEGNEEEQEDTDEDQDQEDSQPDQEGDEEDEDYKKSIDLKSGASVKKALEVSEFLSELVESLNKSLEAQKGEISKSLKSTKNVSEALAKSFEGMAKAQKAVIETQVEVMKSLKALGKKVDAIGAQPQVRKSVANAQVLTKSFDASLGNKPAGNQLSKSQVLSKLTAEFEKGNKAIMNDILNYESNGSLDSLSDQAKNILGQ